MDGDEREREKDEKERMTQEERREGCKKGEKRL